MILSKLDNVDRKKRRRYEFVYGKLHDFEDYMRRLGVDVDLTGQSREPAPAKDPALMGPEETLDSLILLSVEHNLQLMHMLSNEQKFGNIIEAARSTKSWQQLRAYLNVFEEYFTYLSVLAENRSQCLIKSPKERWKPRKEQAIHLSVCPAEDPGAVLSLRAADAP